MKFFAVVLCCLLQDVSTYRRQGKWYRNNEESTLDQCEETRRTFELFSPTNVRHDKNIKLNIETPDAKEEYYRKSSAEVASLKSGQADNDLYPNDFKLSDSYAYYFKGGINIPNTSVSLAGRILNVRKNNPNETVIDLASENGYDIKGILNVNNSFEKYMDVTNNIKRGDIVGIVGFPGDVKSGILPVHVQSFKLLAPCLHEIPQHLQEGDTFRLRYLDLIINKKSKRVFRKRSKIVSFIRRFLEKQDFLEVETPILNKVPGGATAIPFETHHDDLNIDFYLRIAPELYHKMLVVGGFDKIFEIGRQFRNEKIDEIHNPEFTSCEFYMTYVDYNSLMANTELLISELVWNINESYKVIYQPNELQDKISEIDFRPPFPRVPLIPTLEKRLNVTFPPANTLHTPEANNFLYDLCKKHQFKIPTPRTSSKLLDSLVGAVITVNIEDPTFIIDYPEIMSPLAKSHKDSPGLTQRFELYVLGKEIANAYVEQNDPAVQRERFALQSLERDAGNLEVPPTNEEFITALEYGLPPTAGCGLGIDRIVMFLTNSSSVKDVILFPATET